MAPLTLPNPPRFWRKGETLAWPQRKQDDARTAIDGDTVIRLLTAFVVLAVASFAAVISYSHIFFLGRHHGQDGTAARLLPLSVDGLIAAASLVMLHAARNRLSVPWLARAMLATGVGATVAANVAYGLPFGVAGALVSAWPAVAFVGSVEMAVRFVRDARHAATAPAVEQTEHRTAGRTETGAEGDSKTADAQAGSDNLPDRDLARMPDSVADRDRRERRHRQPSARARAVTTLRRNPALTDAEVAKKTGVSERTVQRAREDLAATAKLQRSRPMTTTETGQPYERTDGPVNLWFSLSYANFLVWHRTHMQSMPLDWQDRFVELAEELEAAFPDHAATGYEVATVRDAYVSELTVAEMEQLGITADGESGEYYDRNGRTLHSFQHVGIPVPDPVPHYRRSYLPPDEEAIAAVRAARTANHCSDDRLSG